MVKLRKVRMSKQPKSKQGVVKTKLNVSLKLSFPTACIPHSVSETPWKQVTPEAIRPLCPDCGL